MKTVLTPQKQTQIIESNVNGARYPVLREFVCFALAAAALLVLIYWLFGAVANVYISKISYPRKLQLESAASVLVRVPPSLLQEELSAQTLKVNAALAKILSQTPQIENAASIKARVVKDGRFNAFITVDGKIFITEGLLDKLQNEQQLYFVLAHEMAHYVNRDLLKELGRTLALSALLSVFGADISSMSGGFVNAAAMQFSRRREAAADKFAGDLLFKNFGTRQAAVDFFTLDKQGSHGELLHYLSTHPSHGKRIKLLQKQNAPVDKIPPNACQNTPVPKEDAVVLAARAARAKEILAAMTVQEKVGSLFITGIAGLAGIDNEQTFPAALDFAQLNNLKTFGYGGVIFFGGNIIDDAQIKKYIKDLQAASKLPLFIAVDEEGGIVSRLGSNTAVSVDAVPTAMEIASTKDPQKAFETAQTIARQMKALGFNVDFAPVADILTNKLNTVIQNKARSFGTDANTACAFVPEFVKGLQGQNVAGALKHFPGHGDTVADTHEGRVYFEGALRQLREREFLPFKAGIAAGADFVM
ncbi:MAG: M48 family metalloprotease, partial [Elusimicrobiota bacterium]|nr:M48 family metalloprotease [Elusimicrobiota bacterium]